MYLVTQFGRTLDRADRLILRLEMAGRWPHETDDNAPRFRLRKEVGKIYPFFLKPVTVWETGAPMRIMQRLEACLNHLDQRGRRLVPLVDVSALADLRAQFNEALSMFHVT